MLLNDHMDAIERSLLTQSDIPANSGHSLHKGTPREAFVKQFLETHLSESVAIGSGEIIDSNSKAGEARNQQDIVIYRRDYPKLYFGGNTHAFMAESVVATIEVKSRLTKEDMEKVVQSAHNTKKLQRSMDSLVVSGYEPPSILSYIVAYDGPAEMDTVRNWLTPIHKSLSIPYPNMGKTIQERIQVASPSVDGIFVLGKGFIVFDNSPITFGRFTEARTIYPNYRWVYADSHNGSLLYLFLLLTKAISTIALSSFNPLPYLTDVVNSTIFLAE